MDLRNYKTGEHIRAMTPAEEAMYREMIKGDTHGAGAVDGEPFGLPGVTVYGED